MLSLAALVFFQTRQQCHRRLHAEDPVLLKGHLGAVTGGQFTPDGLSAVTVASDHTVRVWDLASGSERRIYSQHTGPVYCVAVSADGTTAVSGAQDNTLRIWSLPVQHPSRTLLTGINKPVSAAISPDGKLIVAVSRDNTVRAWEQPGDQSKKTTEPSLQWALSDDAADTQLTHVAWNNNNSYFVTASATGQITAWSPELTQHLGTVTGHQGRVSSVQITPGQQIITSGDDGVIRIWQLPLRKPGQLFAAGEELVNTTPLPNQQEFASLAKSGRLRIVNLTSGDVRAEFAVQSPDVSKITALACSPNVGFFVLGHSDGTTAIVNGASGELTGTIASHTAAINSIAVHPDNQRLITAAADGTAGIWKTSQAAAAGVETTEEDKAPIVRFSIDQIAGKTNVPITAVLIAPNQQHVYCGCKDGLIIQWDINNGQVVRTLEGHTDSIAQLAVLPGNQSLISVAKDKSARTWQIGDGTAQQVFEHPAAINAVTAAPDGRRIMTAGDDGIVRIWDVASGGLLQSLTGQTTSAKWVATTDNGLRVVSLSADHTFQAGPVFIQRAVAVHEGAVRSMAQVNAGAQAISCGDDRRILLTDLNSGNNLREFPVGENEPTVVTARNDSQRIAAGTGSGDVIVWNINVPETPLFRFEHASAVTALAWSPDNQKLAVATAESGIHVYGPTIPGVQPTAELSYHQTIPQTAPINSVVFSPDNLRVFASCDDGQIHEWPYAPPAQIRQFNHGGPVYGVDISSDGSTVVSGSTDQTVRVWEPVTGRQRFQLNGHQGAVHSVAMSSDAQFAVSSGADGTLRLWDIVGGRQLKVLTRFDETMYSIALHPNGKLLAAAGADRLVHLIDLATGNETQTLTGHEDYIHSVAFNATNNQLISYGYAGSLRHWNVDNGAQLKEQRIGRIGNVAHFSADGQRILLSNGDGFARIVEN